MDSISIRNLINPAVLDGYKTLFKEKLEDKLAALHSQLEAGLGEPTFDLEEHMKKLRGVIAARKVIEEVYRDLDKIAKKGQ